MSFAALLPALKAGRSAVWKETRAVETGRATPERRRSRAKRSDRIGRPGKLSEDLIRSLRAEHEARNQLRTVVQMAKDCGVSVTTMRWLLKRRAYKWVR